MNAGILAPVYQPPTLPLPLLGQPRPVPMPYGRAGDPYWANVSLYLRMDGPHGSTSFTDLSSSTKAVTTFGNAAITNQRGRFGQSATFGGSPDYLSVAHDSSLDFDADFTIEAFVRSTISSGQQNIVGKWATGVFAWVLFLSAGNTFNFAYGNGSGGFGNQINRTFVYTSGAFHHFAVTRQGGVIRLFANGVQLGATASNSTSYSFATSVNIGRQNDGTNFLNGQIDELRITKGVARYTSNFLPPTAPFPIGFQ